MYSFFCSITKIAKSVKGRSTIKGRAQSTDVNFLLTRNQSSKMKYLKPCENKRERCNFATFFSCFVK